MPDLGCEEGGDDGNATPSVVSRAPGTFGPGGASTATPVLVGRAQRGSDLQRTGRNHGGGRTAGPAKAKPSMPTYRNPREQGLACCTWRLDTSPTAMRPILALLLCIAFAPAALAECRVEQRGVVPVDVVDGHLLVTVQVNDVPATFILDTGAERTLMGEDAVRRLNLERDGWVASAIRGLGGIEQRPDALPRSLRLGDALLRRRTLMGDSSVTVGPLPMNEVAGRPLAGLLGRDFLSPFDLDIDLPAHRMTLFDVQGCGDLFLPWSVPYAIIPATTPMGAALVVQVLVDAQPLRALIDTGASSSLITASGMYRLGLTREALARDPGANGSGIGPAPVPMRLHRFADLRIGPDASRNPSLWVAAVHVVPIVDMLLGADWLRSRHVWLSFATKQLFVAVPRPG